MISISMKDDFWKPIPVFFVAISTPPAQKISMSEGGEAEKMAK